MFQSISGVSIHKGVTPRKLYIMLPKIFSLIRIEAPGVDKEGYRISIEPGSDLEGVRLVIAYGPVTMRGQVDAQWGYSAAKRNTERNRTAA